jgi:hypothetical protein
MVVGLIHHWAGESSHSGPGRQPAVRVRQK